MPADFAPWGDELALTAADGVALRGAVSRPDGARAHVLLLPGRTEFLEKYAGVVARLHARGLAVASLDWRGQGGSERLTNDSRLGHVGDFAAFRADLDALLAAGPVAALPGPRLVVAHSMGGAIALDWLGREGGAGVRAAVLSAPMLGLPLKPPLGWIAPGLARLAVRLGFARHYAPGGGPQPYCFGPFADNLLTGDEASFAALGAFLHAHPTLALGGPSYGWLAAAFDEMQALRERPVPVPSLFVVGTAEKVVDPVAIRHAARIAGARLAEIDGGRHEAFIETPPRRDFLWQTIDAFLGEVLPEAQPV